LSPGRATFQRAHRSERGTHKPDYDLSLSHFQYKCLYKYLNCPLATLQVQRNKVRELWKDGKLVAGKGTPFQRARRSSLHDAQTLEGEREREIERESWH